MNRYRKTIPPSYDDIEFVNKCRLTGSSNTWFPKSNKKCLLQNKWNCNVILKFLYKYFKQCVQNKCIIINIEFSSDICLMKHK